MTVAACPPSSPIVTGVVEFDVAEWREVYPAFASVGDGLLERNFIFAEVLLKNTCCSRVVDANKRQVLLYLLVAHITSLFDTNPTPSLDPRNDLVIEYGDDEDASGSRTRPRAACRLASISEPSRRIRRGICKRSTAQCFGQ